MGCWNKTCAISNLHILHGTDVKFAGLVTGTTTLSPSTVMMGLAVSYTPQRSGVLIVSMRGSVTNNTANEGAIVQMCYGNAAAPANGDLVKGTLFGKPYALSAASQSLAYPFYLCSIISNVGVGVPLWFDLSLCAVLGGTAQVSNVEVTVEEI